MKDLQMQLQHAAFSLVRNGNSKNVHVYIKYKSNQLMNHIKFKQLKIMTPNLLSPLTYKTYEDKSYKFTAKKIRICKYW